MEIRQIETKDYAQVCQLINFDQVKGQPKCSIDMLVSALSGKSPVDDGYWQELTGQETLVIACPSSIKGVLSYAHNERDATAHLLFLHAREDVNTLNELVQLFLAKCNSKEMFCAFSFATSLTSGLEGHPAIQRPKTTSVMTKNGFQVCDLWSYMLLEKVQNIPPDPDVNIVKTDKELWKLHITGSSGAIGEAEVGLLNGVGILWYLEVVAESRNLGFGKRLLDSSLGLFASVGIDNVILYVDDDEPGGERDRSAAKNLYVSRGFKEIDRLLSFSKQTNKQIERN